MDLESEPDDEEENGESSEYFEELKPSPPFSLESKDPIIEISSDSEAEEEVIEALPTSSLPTSTLPNSTLPTSTLPTLPTPTWLNGMNERQQRALLELGMFSDEDSSNVRLPPVGSSRMGSNGQAGPPRIKKSQKRNQNALSDPGVPLQKDSLSLVIERDMAKRPRRALPNPNHLPKKTPCPSTITSTSTTTSTSTSRSLGWSVEIHGGQHFMPCPDCNKKFPRITGRNSLIAHIASSHHQGLHAKRPCQLCPANYVHINRKISVFDVFDHICGEHKINLSGAGVFDPMDIKCPVCQRLVERKAGGADANARALLEHLRTVHGRLIGVTKKIWMVLHGSEDSFVKCPECAGTVVRISNLTRHFNKVHPETGVYDGMCGRCNKSVRKEDLQAHLDCSPSVSGNNNLLDLRTSEQRKSPNPGPSSTEEGEILSEGDTSTHPGRPTKRKLSGVSEGQPGPGGTAIAGETLQTFMDRMNRMPQPVPFKAPSANQVQGPVQAFLPPCARPPPLLPPPPSAPQPEPYNYAVWSVLPGACSFLQCPECPRKLPLDSVHQHLVSLNFF